MIYFEHAILLEGYICLHDDIEEALFKEFGYAYGECDLADRIWYTCSNKHNPNDEDMYTEYPRCADIDIDEYNKFVSYCKKYKIKMYPDDTMGRLGGAGFVLPHSHNGNWYVGKGSKIGYDYMVYSYYFKYKEDLTLFLLKHDNLCNVHILKDKECNDLMKGNAMT